MKLTPAEHKIITLLVSGETSRNKLADATGTTSKSVGSQLSRLYIRVGCENLTGLYHWALHNGWSVGGDYQPPQEAWIANFEARFQALADEVKALKERPSSGS